MAIDQRAREGDLLWTPSPEWIERTNIVAFTRWLRDERGPDFDVTDHHGYDEFWRWSVTDLAARTSCGRSEPVPPRCCLKASTSRSWSCPGRRTRDRTVATGLRELKVRPGQRTVAGFQMLARAGSYFVVGYGR